MKVLMCSKDVDRSYWLYGYDVDGMDIMFCRPGYSLCGARFDYAYIEVPLSVLVKEVDYLRFKEWIIELSYIAKNIDLKFPRVII